MPTNKDRKALGEMRIVGQEFELLAFHFATRPATHAPHFELEIYARVAAREITHAADAGSYQPLCRHRLRFFERRLSLMMRAFGYLQAETPGFHPHFSQKTKEGTPEEKASHSPAPAGPGPRAAAATYPQGPDSFPLIEGCAVHLVRDGVAGYTMPVHIKKNWSGRATPQEAHDFG